MSEDRKIDGSEAFGPLVRKGCGAGPAILFGGAGEIPLLGHTGDSRLDYRIGFLAHESDLAVIG
ncbi:unnamed protein product, partial [Laminaria digitata]